MGNGNNSYHQSDHLPDTDGLPSEAVWQRIIQPGQRPTGQYEQIAHQAQGKYPATGFLQSQCGNAQPEDKERVQLHIETGTEGAMASSCPGDFSVDTVQQQGDQADNRITPERG